jgi:hypothetical protein
VPLRQPLHIGDFGGFFVKDIDKRIANRFAFGLGVTHPLQLVQETRFSIGADNPYTHILRKHRHHLITLIEAQQAVINENTRQLVTNGAMQ